MDNQLTRTKHHIKYSINKEGLTQWVLRATLLTLLTTIGITLTAYIAIQNPKTTLIILTPPTLIATTTYLIAKWATKE